MYTPTYNITYNTSNTQTYILYVINRNFLFHNIEIFTNVYIIRYILYINIIYTLVYIFQYYKRGNFDYICRDDLHFIGVFSPCLRRRELSRRKSLQFLPTVDRHCRVYVPLRIDRSNSNWKPYSEFETMNLDLLVLVLLDCVY